MQKIGTARQLRYFLRQHEDLYDVGTLALNKAINVKGYKISRRKDRFEEEREDGYRQRAYMETIMDLSEHKIDQKQAAQQLTYYIDESRQLDKQGKLLWISPKQ
ncbi:MAG: hypothetical protein EZS28_019429 [Streblomastix strix]|uniref:Uncharacterized protein n=1 Tax=Streblomastix strix TaxID=222440 RepID=A0A5J4VR85_9EUKA|nr:MAG: hypothetical protein EZS28_019429 [Streblomastix strix]